MNHIIRILVVMSLVACAPQGPAGPAGDQGPPGVDGDTGDTGDTGPDGLAGGDARILDADTTWSGSELIDRIVYVPEGITLTIEAGTDVTLLPEAGLFVDGTLIADGASASPISFSPETAFTDDLWGVWLGETSGSSVLDFVRFDRVEVVVRGDGAPTISNATFTDTTLLVSDRPTAAFLLELSTFVGTDDTRRDWVHLTDVSSVTLDGITIDEAGRFLLLDGTEDSSVLVRNATITTATIDVRGPSGGSSSFTLENSTVTDALVKLDDLDGTLDGVDVTGAGVQGDVGDTHTLTITGDSTITDSGQVCLGGVGGLIITGLTIDTCTYWGIEWRNITAPVDMRDITVKNTGLEAMSVGFGTVKDCLIEDNSMGISFYGDGGPSRVENCTFNNNLGGVGGYGATPSLVVKGSNITNSSAKAIYRVDVVDGNYIADNNGQTGPDVTAAGTDDGVYDTTTPQVDGADVIVNGATSPIAGTGPQP